MQPGIGYNRAREDLDFFKVVVKTNDYRSATSVRRCSVDEFVAHAHTSGSRSSPTGGGINNSNSKVSWIGSYSRWTINYNLFNRYHKKMGWKVLVELWFIPNLGPFQVSRKLQLRECLLPDVNQPTRVGPTMKLELNHRASTLKGASNSNL